MKFTELLLFLYGLFIMITFLISFLPLDNNLFKNTLQLTDQIIYNFQSTGTKDPTAGIGAAVADAAFFAVAGIIAIFYVMLYSPIIIYTFMQELLIAAGLPQPEVLLFLIQLASHSVYLLYVVLVINAIRGWNGDRL